MSASQLPVHKAGLSVYTSRRRKRKRRKQRHIQLFTRISITVYMYFKKMEILKLAMFSEGKA